MHVCMVYVCSNEHIAIATHVAYFRKKACIISAGFISYPLVCSERAARATDTGYIRTQPSTLKRVKEEQACSNSTPKAVVAKITESEGGIINCRSSSSLPRNRHQVSNIRQQSSSTTNQDILCAVMEMCLKAKSGSSKLFHLQALH